MSDFNLASLAVEAITAITGMGTVYLFASSHKNIWCFCPGTENGKSALSTSVYFRSSAIFFNFTSFLFNLPLSPQIEIKLEGCSSLSSRRRRDDYGRLRGVEIKVEN